MRLRALLVSTAVTVTAAGAMAVSTQAASTPTIKTRHSKLGTYVVNATGRSLYLFEKDKTSKSSCYGTCAKVWKPLTVTGKPKLGAGLHAALLSTTQRTGGAKQVTYAGHPLYFYDDDHKAGQTEGQGVKEFGAKWYVVAPTGKKIDSD